MTEKKTKPKADWALIEVDFRAGVKSLEQIGADYGVTKGRISQVAKKEGWTRDLEKRIKAKAEAKLNEAAVNKKLNAGRVRLAEHEVVEANATIRADTVLSHRKDITRARGLFSNLLDELELTTNNRELFEQLGELLDESGPDENGRWKNDKANEIYKKVISLTGRVDSGKKLIEMLEKLVKLEREAVGIKDDSGEAGGGVEDLLKAALRMKAERADA